MLIVPNEVAGFLDHCHRFETLEEHVESFVEESEGGRALDSILTEAIPTLIAEGFLIEEGVALSGIHLDSPPVPQTRSIRTLAIFDEGTEADLLRSAEHLLAHLREQRRKVEVVLLSDRPESKELLAVAEMARAEGSILSVVSEKSREDFTRAVVTRLPQAGSALKLALAGTGTRPVWLNALNLSMMSPVDPPTSGAFIAISSRSELSIRQSAKSGAPAVFAEPPRRAERHGLRAWKGDILMAHGRYLGRMLCESVGGWGSRVDASLAASDPDLIWPLPTGSDLCAVTCWPLEDHLGGGVRFGRTLPTYSAIGLQTKCLLPPWPPLSRGAERVFAALLSRCAPGAPWIAHLPFALAGALPGREAAPGAGQVRTADFLAHWLAGGREDFSAAGKYLVRLSDRAERWAETLLETAVRILSRQIAECEQAQDEAGAEAIRRRVEAGDFAIPLEFVGPGGREEFRQFTARYGELLGRWTDLLDAAREVNQTPVRLRRRLCL